MNAHTSLHALSQVPTSVIFFLVGYLARRRGPVGIVHGVVNWNRVSAEGQRTAGRFVATCFYLAALLNLAVAASMTICLSQRVPWGIVTVAPIILMLIVLIVGLRLIARRYPVESANNQHERR